MNNEKQMYLRPKEICELTGIALSTFWRWTHKDDLALHPTVKPVKMVADAIMDTTHRGDIVLDAFLGSGSTLIACEKTGRICRGIELEPKYIDVTIKRWQEMTGKEAMHTTLQKSYITLKYEGR